MLVKNFIIFILLISIVGTASATTFYLRDIPVTGVVPNAKQSGDTITDDFATANATYTEPAQMLETAGSGTFSNSGTGTSTADLHYTHYGTWVTEALGAQTVEGTVTIGLSMLETNAKQNLFPRVKIYRWYANDTYASDLLVLTNSGTEVGTSASLATYFSTTAITSTTILEGDRIVIEIEDSSDPTETAARAHALQYGGTAGNVYGSYVTFSDTITYPPVAPVSAFSANTTSGDAPLSVLFTDASTNTPTAWSWAYKNASVGWTVFSTSQNPTYSFPAGLYDINLTATNAGGSDDEVKTSYINVTVPVVAPVSAFSANTTSGDAPLSVLFTDASTNTPTAWSWAYKNASVGWTVFSTSQNPTYSFPAGLYDINLTATNAGGSDDEVKTSYINSSTPGAGGTIIYYVDAGSDDGDYWGTIANVTYPIIRSSNGVSKQTGGTNGVSPALQTNATTDYYRYLYRGAMIFNTSSLPDDAGIVSATFSTFQFSRLQQIGNTSYGITDLPLTETDMSSGIQTSDFQRFTSSRLITDVPYNSVTLNAYNDYSFTNLTTINKTGEFGFQIRDAWDIDNDTTGLVWAASSSTSLIMRFSEYTGTDYDPYLTIEYSGGVVAPVASFTTNVTSGTEPLSVAFTDTSTNTPTSWNWTYRNVTGNNTQLGFSTSQNPAQVFGVGNYSIALNASNSAGSNWSTQTTYINVSASAGTPPVASFTLNRNPTRIPNSITATDTSTNTPTAWNWSWGDGTANSTTQNPTHIYTTRGRFNIILTATNAAGNGVNSATYVRVVGYENYY